MPKVTMPQLGESVAEGTIGKWLKQPGEHVAKYEPIVEVITDKVNAEVPSPVEGTLTEILVQEGQTVPNNAEIAVIEAAGEAADAQATGAVVPPQPEQAPAPSPSVMPEPAGTSVGTGPSTEEAEGQEARPQTAPQGADQGQRPPPRPSAPAPSAPPPAAAERPAPPATQPAAPVAVGAATADSNGAGTDDRTVLGVGTREEYSGPVTPAVRRLAREHGVELGAIRGTGHAGRVTREDVLAYVEQQRTGAAPAVPPQGAPAQSQPAAAATGAAEEVKPQTPMRKAIAAHMVKAKQTAPHAYTTVEVDMSGVVALREGAKRDYQAREGVALSYVAIVGEAVVEALRKHPDLNAHWTDEGLLRKRGVNLGIAVAVDDGLVVPVIRDADQLSIHGLNVRIQDFAERARANKLRLEDIQGGTFTLNNTGWFGSVASQPIINVPEVAILSMEAIVKRPIVVETPQGDMIAIRPMMNVCVSFDHRATDGAQIGRFVQDVRRWLEAVDSQTAIW